MTDTRLTLPEELILLGWDDGRGRNRYTQNLPMLVAGASVLELVLRDALTIEKDRVHASNTRLDHHALDRVLQEIREDSKQRSIKNWVQRLGHSRWLRGMLLEQLTERGIVRDESSRVLGLFPWSRHPVADSATVTALRERMARALTQEEPVSDARDAALGGLAHSAGGSLIRRLVPREQRQAARRRAKALSKGEAVSADVAKAIGETNAGVMAAAAAAVAAASASAGGGS
ncbi:GOLPH3/VPS74 family protein [Phytoactinopolyspora halophila]|uniref:GOLPH3/VPS74 family protein n=1 Tax=Phytoactinopolyspora halophila TaxID=1981511 RepID=UPI001314AB8D|nr:GPP34 family phosphoprotein [Phytoactinopolyspora halophila]